MSNTLLWETDGLRHLYMESDFIDYLRDLGYESIEMVDLFAEYMDWLEDEAA